MIICWCLYNKLFPFEIRFLFVSSFSLRYRNHTVYPPVIIFEENSLIRKKQLFTGSHNISGLSHLFIFYLNQLVLRRILFAYICIFTLFPETYLPGFIAWHYKILFHCLVILRIQGKSVGRVSFDMGNNRLLEREKQSHIHRFRIRVCHSWFNAHSISMTYHISNHIFQLSTCVDWKNTTCFKKYVPFRKRGQNNTYRSERVYLMKQNYITNICIQIERPNWKMLI